ncbi:16S rRNA (uracil(1498)-N(3))-methyltransferase [bacterium]|nr:16S rRNA (uracil(1498)-N(3))-methyltransferase [bacterium]
MNIILIEGTDFISDCRVLLSGRRALHIVKVLKSNIGDKLRAGLVDGNLGQARVTKIVDAKVELEFEIAGPPPTPLPVSLLLALPRPKVFKRVLSAAVTMGVKEIFLFNSWRVEKSYWQTPLLQPEKLKEISLLALEQAIDTKLPYINLKPLFRPFAEDEVPLLTETREAFILHPHPKSAPKTTTGFPSTRTQKTSLIAIGPEGGFIPFEVEMLMTAGLKPISLGPRILRVEQAVPAALAQFIT